jgi:hypothetical protein
MWKRKEQPKHESYYENYSITLTKSLSESTFFAFALVQNQHTLPFHFVLEANRCTSRIPVSKVTIERPDTIAAMAM